MTLYPDNPTVFRPGIENYQTGFSVNWSKIGLFALIGFIVALLSDVPGTAGPIFIGARAVLLLLLVISLFLPARIAIPLFFILLVGGVDSVQTSSAKSTEGLQTVAGLWKFQVSIIRPSWFVAACILIQMLKVMPIHINKVTKHAIVWFATVPVITSIMYGAPYTIARSIEIPQDLRFAVVLVANIILFYNFFRKYPESINIMLAVLVGCFLSRYACDTIYWFVGRGATIAGLNRVSVDSAKSCVIFNLLFAIWLIVKHKKIVLGTVLGLSSCLLLMVYATRLNWVTAVLACAILLVLFGAKRLLIVFPIFLIIVFGSIKLIAVFSPETTLALSETAGEFSFEQTNTNYLVKLDPLRYGEIVNSLNTTAKRLAFVWGNGYGSYYTDEVFAFPSSLVDAHPVYSEKTGEFYWLHNFPFQMLFKHGIIGAVIIFGLWILPARKFYKYFDRTDKSLYGGIMLCLLAFILPAMINLWWSGKGLFINGFIIGLFMALADFYEHQYVNTEMEQSGEAFVL